jgi:DNA-binding SARP family transcriptional activator
MTAPSGYESWPWVPNDGPAPAEDGYVCEVYLLGQIRIVKDGVLIEGGWRRKALELLAFLSVHPSGVAKDQILEALWPEGVPKETQRYLWHSVSHLRRRLGGPGNALRLISKTDDSYRLDLRKVWVDVAVFESAVREAEDSSAAAQWLGAACDIYKGEFCEGRYFGWATLATERLKALFAATAKELSVHLEECGEVERALLLLDRAIGVDPYDEDLCRRAMTLEAQRGRRDQVVRRFRRVRRLLLTDFGVDPSSESETTFKALIGESFPAQVGGMSKG